MEAHAMARGRKQTIPRGVWKRQKRTMSRILVVEDDKQSAVIMERMLRKIGGHEVCVTQSPAVVFDKVRREEVDLILLDVSLSDSTYENTRIDGIEICRRIKAGNGMRAVPVVLITAHAMRGDRERFLEESGADSYQAKPILDYRSLCQGIQELICPPSPLGTLAAGGQGLPL
jgi:CheY-like chemotaxis protein